VITKQGNAADALVGTTLCVGVVGEWIFMLMGQERGMERGFGIEDGVLMRVGMQHSGIGGGGFMLVRDKDGNYESIGMKSLCPHVKHI
jgi:gamma-glutamyltranspeptidase/glutathione hydrolase